MEKKVIKFGSDTKYRKQFFSGVSFSHPAKLHLSLQLWLIENFTKEGETILDPMAGSGTILVACSLGRHVIAVELEAKFIEIIKGNWQKIQERGCQMGYSMGTATILQGDARNLTGILVDKCIFSAPYPASGFGKSNTNTGNVVNLNQQVVSKNRPTSIGRGQKAHQIKYADQMESNIGNLPYGQIDKIITSPPFSSMIDKRTERDKFFDKAEEIFDRRYLKSRNSFTQGQPENPSNIGNLPYGQMDSLCSPPYEGSIIDGNENFEGIRKIRGNKASQKDKFRAIQFGKETTAYGKVDAVISSPPYEGQMESARHVGGIVGRENLRDNGGDMSLPVFYAEQKDNIGNLKSGSYLSAMLQVYQQCYAVLRPGGLMILVVKSFIRNKRIVDLATDTILLCEKSRFVFKDRWYRELTSTSFWRTIYKQRYPEAPEIKYEDILIFSKG